jgi:hypothetical protein
MINKESLNPIIDYNKPFFGLWENIFQELKLEYGKETAIKIATKVMRKSLAKSYDSIGFKKGDPFDFERVLKLRDNAVGIKVNFPEISENKIIYQFITDPFPNLKNDYTTEEIYSTFIPFKIEYLLGPNWNYIVSKDMWTNSHITEITINKIV